jgi:hypothetical protein
MCDVAGRTKALEELTSTYATTESTVQRLVGTAGEHAEALRSVRDRLSAAVSSVAAVDAKCTGVLVSVAQKVDAERFDAQLKTVLKSMEQLIERVAHKATTDNKLTVALHSELKTKLSEFQAYV